MQPPLRIWPWALLFLYTLSGMTGIASRNGVVGGLTISGIGGGSSTPPLANAATGTAAKLAFNTDRRPKGAPVPTFIVDEKAMFAP